jgi:hypothetical protein
MQPRVRFRAPRFDPKEGSWLVIVFSPMPNGSYLRSRRWYRSARDSWQFIERACSDLQGEVLP